MDASDFGVSENNMDNGPALRAAISHCDRNGAILSFPSGILKFADQGGFVCTVDGYNGLEIEGNGAHLVFEKVVSALQIINSGTVCLRNLKMDWARAPHSEGTIESISADGLTVTVKIHFNLSWGDASPSSLQAYEPSTLAPLRSLKNKLFKSSISSTTRINDDTVKFTLRTVTALRAGDLVVMTIRRALFGILSNSVIDLKIYEIEMSNVPGIAVIGWNIRDIDINRLVVSPSRHAGLLSSSADGCHFTGCSGKISIKRSKFVNTGDDCVNINTSFLSVSKVIGPNELVLNSTYKIAGNEQHLPRSAIPQVGDRLQIIGWDGVRLFGRGEVGNVTQAEEGPLIRIAGVDLSNLSAQQLLVCNLTHVPTISISECSFQNSTGCGCLVHANSTIRNCVFTNLGWLGINCLFNSDWLEGPLTTGISILNNFFVGCGRTYPGTISIGNSNREFGAEISTSVAMANRDIRVVGNVFEWLSTPVISIGLTENATIQRNRFAQITPEEGISLPRILEISGSRKINIVGNFSEQNALVEIRLPSSLSNFSDNQHMLTVTT